MQHYGQYDNGRSYHGHIYNPLRMAQLERQLSNAKHQTYNGKESNELSEKVQVPAVEMSQSHDIPDKHPQQLHSIKDRPDEGTAHGELSAESFTAGTDKQKDTANEEPYNSYKQFNPGQFKEGSRSFNWAMIRYLLDMKKHGHKIQEKNATKVRTAIHYP